MKRLLARSAVALLAAPLILLAGQGSPGKVSASGTAPSASVVAQAHAQFVKVMSSHAPGTGENNYRLRLIDHTRPQESFSVTRQCASKTCADASAEWIVERPATIPPFNIVQILPLADFGRTFFSGGEVVSGGRFSSIERFRDGPVYDISMIDDTTSYYLACVGQPAPPGTLLTVGQADACPTVAPFPGGAFGESWDSSF